MSRLLWNDRGTPDRKKGRDTMGFTGSFAPVTTLFAVQSHLDRSSIHLFAQTHPEVRALAVVSTGREVLQLLQNGLNPQVIVLDMQLRDPGIQTLICGIRAMQLVPKPRLLLSAPTPEQTSGEDALLTFRGQEVILRPYEMRTLFERVYLLGAGDEAAQLYRVRNHCRRILRDMQANPVLSGCTYLERMILFAWSDERDLPIGILYQMAAKDQPVDERAITAAVGRLSRAMQKQGTPLYQQLCVRFGLPQDAVQPTGKMMKRMLASMKEMEPSSRKGSNRMLQDDESLALALRGGLRGRFQGTFNQLENAVEVLDDYMLQHLNPAEYADLRTMMREINWQLAYLRRLGDHAADAAAAPVLQMLRVPAPLELLSQLHETVELFNELTVGGTRAVHARLETAPGLDVFPTMGDPALLDGLLVNLFTNSIQAVPEPDAVEITLTCTQNQLLYRDNGPGLPQDARRLLLEGVWTSELLAKGGLGLPLIQAYCTAMGWQISQPEGERGLLFTLPACQAEDLGMLHLSAPDTGSTRRRRRLYESELRLYLSAPEEPSDT